jgi:hypothetical protein
MPEKPRLKMPMSRLRYGTAVNGGNAPPSVFISGLIYLKLFAREMFHR